MRLIDADALMQKLGITDMDCGKCAWYSKAYRRCKRGGDFEDACVAIEDAPTVDAVQERKGRWIKENIVLTSNPPQFQWHCSECGRIKHWFTSEVLTEYCPHCGAHMEGAEDAGREH